MGLHRGVRYTGVRCIDALWYIQRSKVFFFNEIGGDIITPNERQNILNCALQIDGLWCHGMIVTGQFVAKFSLSSGLLFSR